MPWKTSYTLHRLANHSVCVVKAFYMDTRIYNIEYVLLPPSHIFVLLLFSGIVEIISKYMGIFGENNYFVRRNFIFFCILQTLLYTDIYSTFWVERESPLFNFSIIICVGNPALFGLLVRVKVADRLCCLVELAYWPLGYLTIDYSTGTGTLTLWHRA